MANYNEEARNVRVQPIVYRIFLASPGDVRDERELARAVIEQIRSERAFRNRIDLQCIGWDQPGAEVAMEANLTPQEAIKKGLLKPSQCDLVVVILWSRIGTPLPPEYKKPDGTGNLSGTEWEYLDAISAGTTVWLYRRIQVPLVAFNDPDFQEKHQQWEKVEAFFRGLAGEGGSLRGGVNVYQNPDEFRRQFEQHLRDRLTAVLEELAKEDRKEPRPQEDALKALVQWTAAPYPGLEAFKPEQAPIFFGRGTEIDHLLELLRDPAIRFIAVAGASGSGKSSLVAAGLIPRLRAGALPGSEQWVDITFRPTERGENPILSLAYALKTSLGATGQREAELAEDLKAAPARLAACAGELLRGRTNGAELLLFVDQFEEIFIRVNADSQRSFVKLIEIASRTAKVRVIATIRADFTANVTESPSLTQLFRGRGYYLLAAPGPLALTDMIRRPAQLAGLEIQDELAERVLRDTGTGSGALALMAFALHEVYQRGKDSGRLTLKEYESLGGVSGTIKAQAERALQRAGRIDDRALHALFSNIVEVNDQGVATRRRADLGEIRKNPQAARVADALVDSRILVTGHEPSQVPDSQPATIEVAHEAVFSGWPRLSTWIDSHAGELRICRRLAGAAQDWKAAGAPLFKHLPDRATLKQYRKVLPACPLGDEAKVVGRFLSAGWTRQRVFESILSLVVTVSLGLGALFWWATSHDYPPAIAAQGLLTRVGVLSAIEPEMLPVPAGFFQMGSPEVEPGRHESEGPVQTVTFQHPFAIGKNEVTFAEYDRFAAATGRRLPMDQGWGRGSRPVINISWEEAQAYAVWLSKVTGKDFRLPAEAEWEYACRAGSKTAFSFGDDDENLGKFAWFDANSDRKTYPVGEKEPNAWGLHDMHGNVWEWVEDDWHGGYEEAPNDGRARVNNPRRSSRVIRGGSWYGRAHFCRSAMRYDYGPGNRREDVGFRLSRSVSLGP